MEDGEVGETGEGDNGTSSDTCFDKEEGGKTRLDFDDDSIAATPFAAAMFAKAGGTPTGSSLAIKRGNSLTHFPNSLALTRRPALSAGSSDGRMQNTRWPRKDATAGTIPAKRCKKKCSGEARKVEKEGQTPCVVSVQGLIWYSL